MYELSEKIAAALTAKGIPFTVKPHHIFLGDQFRFPWTKGDFFITFYSQAHYLCEEEEDFLFAESCGFPWDDGDITCWSSDEEIDELIEKIVWLYNLFEKAKKALETCHSTLEKIKKSWDDKIEQLEKVKDQLEEAKEALEAFEKGGEKNENYL